MYRLNRDASKLSFLQTKAAGLVAHTKDKKVIIFTNQGLRMSSFNHQRRISVGFLTYDLQPFVQELLLRIQNDLAEKVRIRAYPVYFHPAQNNTAVEFVPSRIEAVPFLRNRINRTPEGMARNWNLRAAIRIAKENDIVVLYGLHGVSAVLTVLFARLLGRTVISVNHTLSVLVEKNREWWIKVSKKMVLKLCDVHIGQTSVALDVLESVYNRKRETLFLAPFSAGIGFLVGFFSDFEEKCVAKSASANVSYLFVGNMIPFKGVEDILLAASKLSKELDFKILMTGKFADSLGYSRQYYVDMADTYGIADRVEILGNLELADLVRFYKNSDVVILPTHKDCTPKVLVEAALAGKPIITTDVHGWIGTVVQDGENAIVIKPGDIAALSAAMVRMSDPELRAKMGKASRRLVEYYCDPAKETEGFIKAINAADELRRAAKPREKHT